jgi:polyisoprenyl-phosphate glycosyltransferase
MTRDGAGPKTLSVIVPVYYNEGSLPLLYDELAGVERRLLDRGVRLELIFVDDGSGDGSYRELLAIKARRPETVVVKLSRNFGAIHASKTGLRFVTGDGFLYLAADLQDPPGLIVDMVDRWLAGSKYVVCVREQRRDPLATRLFARAYYRLVRLAVVADYPEGGFDLALMDRAILQHMRAAGKNFNPHVFAYWLGFKPARLSYVRQERKHGKSRWTVAKKLKFFLDTLLGFSAVPLRAISAVGVVAALLSGGYGTTVVLTAVVRGTDVPGFATLASLLSFLLGLIIVMLGVIGEYLWRVFDELNRRPEAVIDEVHLPDGHTALVAADGPAVLPGPGAGPAARCA